MKRKNIILYLLMLTAYTLSLAHSIIPHHHHETAQEAAAHNHTENHHHTSGSHHHHHDPDHGQNDDKKHADETGHSFFFTHDLNVDVLVNHGSIDSPVKNKKAQLSSPSNNEIPTFHINKHLVFHPPQDDPFIVVDLISSGPLRAPPYFI